MTNSPDNNQNTHEPSEQQQNDISRNMARMSIEDEFDAINRGDRARMTGERQTNPRRGGRRPEGAREASNSHVDRYNQSRQGGGRSRGGDSRDDWRPPPAAE